MINILRSCDIFYTPLSFHTEKSSIKAATFIFFAIIVIFFAIKEIVQNIIITPKVNSILDLGEYPSSSLKAYPPFKLNFTVTYYDKTKLFAEEKCELQITQKGTNKQTRTVYPKINKSLFFRENFASSEFEVLMDRDWFNFNDSALLDRFLFGFEFNAICQEETDYYRLIKASKEHGLFFRLFTNTYKMLKPNLQKNFADRNFNPVYSSNQIEIDSINGKSTSIKYNGLVHYIYDDLALFWDNKKNDFYNDNLKPSLAEISFLSTVLYDNNQDYKINTSIYNIDNIQESNNSTKNNSPSNTTTEIITRSLNIITLEIVGSNSFYLFIRKYENVQQVLSNYFSMLFVIRETLKFIFILFDIKGKYFKLFNSVVVMKYYDEKKSKKKNNVIKKDFDSNSSDSGSNVNSTINNAENNSLLYSNYDYNEEIGNPIINSLKEDKEYEMRETGNRKKNYNSISSENYFSSLNKINDSNSNIIEGSLNKSNSHSSSSSNVTSKIQKSTDENVEKEKTKRARSISSNNIKINAPDLTKNSSINISKSFTAKPNSINSKSILPSSSILSFKYKKRNYNHKNKEAEKVHIKKPHFENNKLAKMEKNLNRLYFNEFDRLLLFFSCFSRRLKFKKEVFDKTQDNLRAFYHEYTSSESNFLINSFIANTYKEKIFDTVFKEFIWDNTMRKNNMISNNQPNSNNSNKCYKSSGLNTMSSLYNTINNFNNMSNNETNNSIGTYFKDLNKKSTYVTDSNENINDSSNSNDDSISSNDNDITKIENSNNNSNNHDFYVNHLSEVMKISSNNFECLNRQES